MVKITLQGALNDVLVQIVKGTNYASELARTANKSIPVMHRQLKELAQQGFITAAREGKRVVYVLQWNALGKLVAEHIFIQKSHLADAIKTGGEDAEELARIMAELPPQLFENIDSVTEMITEAFNIKKIGQLFIEFLSTMTKTASFAKTGSQFIDTIGMLPAQFKQYFPKEQGHAFLKYCRAQHLYKKLTDPQQHFLAKMKK